MADNFADLLLTGAIAKWALLAQKESILVPDNRKALFANPVKPASSLLLCIIIRVDKIS